MNILKSHKKSTSFLVILFTIFIALLFLKKPVEPDFFYDSSSDVYYWQTYTQNHKGVHYYSYNESEYFIDRLNKPNSDFKTAFGFVKEGNLIFRDMINDKNYILKKNVIYKRTNTKHNRNYISHYYEFNHDNEENIISACPLDKKKSNCISIEIYAGTFPYVYATKNDSVIAITNWGDALLFKNGQWCRMQMIDDIYFCDNEKRDPIDQPRKIQFYSSILYQGDILIGEWPTGGLYEFDGTTLKRSNMTPPYFDKQSDQRLGYEAQSMAEYCGDLFIGYWPKGEIWRYDRRRGEWSLFIRLFSVNDIETFIPHSNRETDELDRSFFGQRVTALIPHENYLYAVTSNLNSWGKWIDATKILEQDKIDEYGSIYRIFKTGCKTTYF